MWTSKLVVGLVGTGLLTLVGCSAAADRSNQFGDPCGLNPACVGANSAADDPDDDPDADATDDAGKPEDDDTGGSDEGGSNPDTGEPPPGQANGLPCEVRDALAANCLMCHSDPAAFGAPMPLVTFQDLSIPTPTDPTTPVYDKVIERILDPDRPMPDDGVMLEEHRQALIDWVAAGSPEDPNADCDDSTMPDPNAVGPEALPCEPDVVITAHAEGSEEPFHVPAQGADNMYRCFNFPAPFTTPTQATHWAPIIDDERVVHHWILYRTKQPPPGDVSQCGVDIQLTADFVAGWAPGGGNIEMPDDVGLELGEPGDWYQLQIHYHNTAHHADAFDKSGVAFCTTDQPRPQSAGILTTGTTGLWIPANSTRHAQTGECQSWRTQAWPQDLHIMGSSPHMHSLGAGFHNTVTHQDGTTEVIVDLPNYDWENQKMYFNDNEIIVRPGDSISTTCEFTNPTSSPVGFGENSEQEMCFNFILAYPIESLPSRNCGISILG